MGKKNQNKETVHVSTQTDDVRNEQTQNGLTDNDTHDRVADIENITTVEDQHNGEHENTGLIHEPEVEQTGKAAGEERTSVSVKKPIKKRKRTNPGKKNEPGNMKWLKY